jgi:hypothetical protein
MQSLRGPRAFTPTTHMRPQRVSVSKLVVYAKESRVGRYPVAVPKTVQLTLDGQTMKVKVRAAAPRPRSGIAAARARRPPSKRCRRSPPERRARWAASSGPSATRSCSHRCAAAREPPLRRPSAAGPLTAARRPAGERQPDRQAEG